jgi:hypothetical protein
MSACAQTAKFEKKDDGSVEFNMSKCEKEKVGSDSSGRPQHVIFSCNGIHHYASEITSHQVDILNSIKTGCEKSGGRYSQDADEKAICEFSTKDDGYVISAYSIVLSAPYEKYRESGRILRLYGRHRIILKVMDAAEYQAWTQSIREAEQQRQSDAQARWEAEARAKVEAAEQARLQAEQREKQENQAAQSAAADWSRASASLRNSLKPGDQVYLILERKDGRAKGLPFEVPAMVINVKPPLAEVQFSEFLDVASIRRWEKFTDIYAKAPEIFFCKGRRWQSAWNMYTKTKDCLRTQEEVKAIER